MFPDVDYLPLTAVDSVTMEKNHRPQHLADHKIYSLNLSKQIILVEP